MASWRENKPMLNKVITLDMLMSWKPCYDREKILRLSHGRTELTVSEIIDLRFVPAEDKLWLLLRKECIPARTLHEFAIWCAETALTRAKVTDERSWNTLKVKQLWLDGKATDKELDSAMAAAWEAAWEVTSDAAMAAAWEAAKAAARNVARYAARDVARYTAWDAARYAAMAAARDDTRDVAKATTWDATMDAARADARFAIWAAAMAAATSAARNAQLAKLKEMLRDNTKEKIELPLLEELEKEF
jgi:hypothetical protein